jgi:hypothetical protein
VHGRVHEAQQRAHRTAIANGVEFDPLEEPELDEDGARVPTGAMRRGENPTRGQRRMEAVLRAVVTEEDEDDRLAADTTGMTFVRVPSDEARAALRLFGPPAPNHADCFACDYGLNEYATTVEKARRVQYLMVRGRREMTLLTLVPKIARLHEEQIRAPANRKRANLGLPPLRRWSEATIWEHLKYKVPADADMWRINSLEITAEMVKTQADAQVFRRNRYNPDDKRIAPKDGDQLIKYQMHEHRLHALGNLSAAAAKGTTEDMIIAAEIERDLVFRPTRFSLSRSRFGVKTDMLDYAPERFGPG